MIVVVGGHTRNAGKTHAICEIIRNTPEVSWTAVKLSRHGHGSDLVVPRIMEETESSPSTDTGRYLEAGAARAFWIRATHDQTPEALSLLPPGEWIVESTSVLDFLVPDLFIFVVDPTTADWKESALRHAGRADVRMTGDASPAIAAVQQLLRAQSY